MTDNRIHEASGDVANSVRDTNQALANSLLTVQDRNVKFAHSVFLKWTELLENQTETTQTLMREWGQQIQKQQDAFQRLTSATMEVYLNFLLAPFTFSQQVVQAGRTAMDRELQVAQKAT